MNFSWKHLSFALKDEILYLTRFGNMEFPEDYRGSLLAEVQVEGGHKNSHSGAKAIFSSEGSRAKYVSHEATDDRLTVTMRSPVTEIKVIFDAYRDCNTLRIHTEVTNVTDSAIKLEEVSAFIGRAILLHKGRVVADQSMLDLEEEGKDLMTFVKEAYRYKADRVLQALDKLTETEE